jgi:hypothetical protein
MAISSFGNGLTIAICCDFVSHHDWMSFLTYWSIKRNLPEAEIIISSIRRDMDIDIFNWPRRCGSPLFYHRSMSENDLHYFLTTHPKNKIKQPVICVKPEVVFVRSFDEASFDPSIISGAKNISEVHDLISDVKSENHTVCCNYSDGWGNFVTSEWINKRTSPLLVGKYETAEMTVNEARLAKLWTSASKIYQSISRG